MKINKLTLLFLIFISIKSIAQLGIKATNTAPDAKAMLDVESADKGVLIPRMNTATRNAIISPPNGLMIYNNQTNKFNYYDGTAWQETFFGNQWAVNGTNISYSGGNVGIGITAPSQKLDITGNLKVSGAIMPAGQAGTAGQVLTSAGASTAPLWSNTAYTGGGRFYIIPANNSRSTGSFTGRGGFDVDGALNETTQQDSLDFGSTNETGSEFTINNPGLTNNFITINKTGLYHFEGVIRSFVTCTNSVTMLPRATLNILINSSPDLNILLIEDLMEKTGGTETGNAATTFNYTAKFQLNIHLNSSSQITFNTGFNNLRYPGSTDLIALGVSTGGYISGQFIAE